MSVDSSNVYVGLWTDWTKGRVLGAVITVPSSTGSIVVALLAMYTQVAGIHLWHLLRFALYQLRVTDKGVHPIARQVQTILRNDGSAASTSLRLFTLLWYWRGRRAPLRSVSTLGAVGFAFAAAVALAGVFSSTIITAADIVALLASPHCGKFDEARAVSDPQIGIVYVSQIHEASRLASTYARQCYNGTLPSQSCNGFAVPTISWATDYYAPCPFGEELCNGPAMTQDTGRLNSNAAFGFNFPADKQIDFRRRLTCAPIIQDGFVQTVPYMPQKIANISTAGLKFRPENEPANITYYFYGSRGDGSNYTAALDSYISKGTATYIMSEVLNFRYSRRTFDPIPALNRSDGGLILTFIQATGIVYTTPVDDLLFAAHQPFKLGRATVYGADRPAGVIGCLEQFQLCLSERSSTCTSLGLWYDVRAEAEVSLNLNDVQNATVDALNEAIALAVSPAQDSGDSLVAQQHMYGGQAQFSLPANQWQIEAENFQSRTMAYLQVGLRTRALGPIDPIARQFILPPATNAEMQLCLAHRVRIGQGFSNISLLGLLLVLIPGILIIAISLVLDTVIAGLAQSAKRKTAYALQSWNHDSLLQIQRIAYERQTERKWDNLDGEVPVTLDDEVLEPLQGRNQIAQGVDNAGPSLELKGQNVESSRLMGFS